MNTSELRARLRESDPFILQCLAKGMTSRQIAKELLLSSDAVDQLVYRMRLRIGAKNKTQAVAIAMKHRIIKG